jgi:ribonuclease E
MKKEMLINVLQPEECRIAIVEDGVLEELYVERTSHESYTGNIYKGKIVNLEPAIQAAFVDFSVGRNGFLHVSDVEPQYFHRHGTVDDEPAARPRAQGRERERERDRGKKPPPRRDRGRGREERRPGLPPEPGDAPPPFPSPPRIEDRPRERDRDREPPPGRDREPPRDRDRGRERERPDQSIRGRRDRSEPPRRFGEGLVEQQDAGFGPPPRQAEPPQEPVRPHPAEDVLTDAPEPPEPAALPEAAELGWDTEIGWGREPEPARTPERHRERDLRHEEPEEPLVREFEQEPVFDPDLPPSRTHRSRPMADRPRPGESESSSIPHRVPPSFPAKREPKERTDPGIPEPDIESFGSREPRKGRGRDRTPPAPGRGRPAPTAGRGAPPVPEIDRDLPRSEPEFEDVPPFDEPPRRRGGRAAIRSRGGDWDRPRETPAAPAPDVDRPPDPGRRRLPEAAESPREPERERPREPERERPRDRDRDRDRERPRPHARAGEPGYIPRRERLRSGDSPFGEDLFPAETEWPEGEIDPLLEEDTGILAADLPDEDELSLPEEESPGRPGVARPDGRRRRRRRGRRREPERETGKYEPSALPPPDDIEPEFEDFPIDLEAPRPFARGARPPVETFDELDELDLEEIGGPGSLPLDDDEFVIDEPRAVAEEEIDPELEQEIRKEIEEIEELEREMGLRGGPEDRARPGEEPARGGRSGRGRGPLKPPIQEIFRRGDEVLIQVIKESIGTKGPTLSTYISIPGRYLVLMPGLNRVGVSRKIVDEGQRRKLREIMLELNPPKGLGFIVRTAGLERTKRELARDLAYLLRLWKVILRRIKKSRAPTPIYQESDMIIRTIRDIFTSEIDTIWIDEPSAFERAQDFLRVVMPRFVNRLKLYDEKVPLFHKYGIEDEISKIQRRHVPLPEGGSIVIDQTEALVAIDVNSGNFRVEDDAERTAYEMNLRAAREIARQLRLRDLGGVIVNDFIDMREERHRRGVERALRDAIKRDRARTKVLRMSAFGLIEMTRQRIRPSLKRSIYEDCSHCTGAGVVKTAESMAIDVVRLLALATHREEIRRIAISVNPRVASYLNNRKRKEIVRMELECNMTIQIGIVEDAPAEHLTIECFDANGSEVRLHPQPPPPPRRGH